MINTKPLIAIMACDEAGLIGKGMGLPDWHCPDDVQHYRETTQGHTLLMGDTTYQCLKHVPGFPFHQHTIIVVTHLAYENTAGFRTVPDVQHLPRVLQETPVEKKNFLIGGADLTQQLFRLNMIDEFILSEIAGTYTGDCYFNAEFLARLRRWPVAKSEKRIGCTIRYYRNPTPSSLI